MVTFSMVTLWSLLGCILVLFRIDQAIYIYIYIYIYIFVLMHSTVFCTVLRMDIVTQHVCVLVIVRVTVLRMDIVICTC